MATYTLTTGDDVLVGTDGDDVFSGPSGGVDRIEGGYGNDTLHGGENGDMLDGGAGDDVLVFEAADHAPWGQLMGGAGYDRAFISNVASLLSIDISGVEELHVEAGRSDFHARIAQLAAPSWLEFAPRAILYGEGGVLDFTGRTGQAIDLEAGNMTSGLVLIGERHDDRLIGSYDHDDVISGRDGNDTLMGAGGNDTLYGGAGDDVLGADPLDQFFGWLPDRDYGDDLLYGGAGNDLLYFDLEGSDTLFGGAGDDTLIVGERPSWEPAIGLLDGGAGFDIVTGPDLGELVLRNVERLAATPYSGPGILASIEQLMAVQEIDASILSLSGGGGHLDLSERMAPEVTTPHHWGGMDGLLAIDLFAGGLTGGLDLTGTVFTDNVYGTEQSDVLRGQGNDDTLRGEGGNDQLFGNWGDDRLEGGDGDDTMGGVYGDNVLIGGRGDDLYRISDAGDDVREAADEGIDTVIVTRASSYTLGDNVENLFLRTGSDAQATGNGLDNEIRTRGGYDRLEGLEGDDTLIGGGKSDTLDGGAGDDVLIGGWGRDVLTGGAGADTFVLDKASGKWRIDTITDFETGTDTIALDGDVFGLAQGALPASAFLVLRHLDDDGLGSDRPVDPVATMPGQRLLYDAPGGRLFFDADGSGQDAPQLLARLTPGLDLTADDFSVV